MKLNEEKRIIEYLSHKMQITYCRAFKNPAIIYFPHATHNLLNLDHAFS